jgi:hypothetical protein
MISVPISGGDVDTWQPNKLVADEENVAYEPKDKEGRILANALTLYLRLLMHRVKMKAPPNWRDHIAPWEQAGQMPNCRCNISAIYPQK